MTAKSDTDYNKRLGNYTLYRLWAADELLYVGLTITPRTRFAQYNRMVGWWTEVTHITVEHLESVSRIEAHAREAATIQAENPRYNRAHNKVA
jgi:hypothetical protein